MILEGGKQEKNHTIKARIGTHNYNNRSRENHVTTFNNKHQMFKKDMRHTSTTLIGSEYIAHTNPQRYTIPVEPVEHHINFETNEKN